MVFAVTRKTAVTFPRTPVEAGRRLPVSPNFSRRFRSTTRLSPPLYGRPPGPHRKGARIRFAHIRSCPVAGAEKPPHPFRRNGKCEGALNTC